MVKDLDLKVPGGCIYGFLGPNGAGKSTTMKMILGLAKPTSGTVTVLGKTVNGRNRLSILKDTGSLIESPSYYGHLSGRENLQVICTLKQVPESAIDEVLQTVRMEKQQNKKVGQYSLGMKQRLGLAAALLGHPRILLLDEPTNGLDPAGIQEMRELICTLPSRYGMTVLVSSHLLSEIDQRTTDDRQSFLSLKHSGLPVEIEKENLYLLSDRDEDILHAGTILSENKLGILRLEEQQKSLEDIFLNLTGRSISL